ncbi:MAG: peroxiredoxin [Planctomycetes bacterium]|nr:peroxiredoxin [Planctomycetota bacterium]MCA8936009.1 peroxiredoxin [Planctomycetota bacterium]
MVWIPGFGKYTPKQGNRVGDDAPDFTLKDHDGNEVKLSGQVGDKPVVLVFYPRAGSPICTKQMCSLRDGWTELMAKAKVFGVSYDGVEQVRKFKEQQKLPFTLLSDPNKKVAKLYGVDGTFAAARVTFVIGTDGKIKAAIDSINANEHAKQVLKAL